jgi:hypothetical protein
MVPHASSGSFNYSQHAAFQAAFSWSAKAWELARTPRAQRAAAQSAAGYEPNGGKLTG